MSKAISIKTLLRGLGSLGLAPLVEAGTRDIDQKLEALDCPISLRRSHQTWVGEGALCMPERLDRSKSSSEWERRCL